MVSWRKWRLTSPCLVYPPEGHLQTFREPEWMSASLIGRLGSSTFRLSITAVLMCPTGSRFSSESAPGPSIIGEAEQSFEARLLGLQVPGLPFARADEVDRTRGQSGYAASKRFNRIPKIDS